MKQFLCNHCQILFSDTGKRKEWIDKIYGPYHKWVAFYPECKDEVGEYNPPKRSKSKTTNTLNLSCGCGSFGKTGLSTEEAEKKTFRICSKQIRRRGRD